MALEYLVRTKMTKCVTCFLFSAHTLVTRQAVIQIFDRIDLREKHNDIPCTCTLQLAIRDERLHLLANMRSNDWFSGLPHDVFAFTMLQEMLARALGIEVGTYKHCRSEERRVGQ